MSNRQSQHKMKSLQGNKDIALCCIKTLLILCYRQKHTMLYSGRPMLIFSKGLNIIYSCLFSCRFCHLHAISSFLVASIISMKMWVACLVYSLHQSTIDLMCVPRNIYERWFIYVFYPKAGAIIFLKKKLNLSF